jgi:phage terminase Nu1 subunit (DNA packaging protein)
VPVKVKISYTVELDEVPNQVRKYLHNHASLSLDKTFEGIIKLIQEGNIQGALDDIDFFRKDLAKLDLKLDDAQSILDGYMRARYSSNSQTEEDVSKE